MAKQYKVGIYCRLSVDDASNSAKAKGYIPSDESVSIENQYEILSKFVMLNGWIEVKTYQDDGYSAVIKKAVRTLKTTVFRNCNSHFATNERKRLWN